MGFGPLQFLDDIGFEHDLLYLDPDQADIGAWTAENFRAQRTFGQLGQQIGIGGFADLLGLFLQG
ncbi:hypothetical protein [Pseudomonas sp. GL93]|uniref:hypothetical protein n=1 Tax=Pseudomonas sp. GL93 TaxID=2014741 RepID=UPI0015B618DD|nr:hypothetical protein [Pseudomonas sp. GL93]